jgi:hypothetical protein
MALLIKARRNRLRALQTIAAREQNIFAAPQDRAHARRAAQPSFQSRRAG